MKDAAGAEALAQAVSTPGSAQYGKYISAAQWRSRFSPDAHTVAGFISWLKSNGFTVTSSPDNHLLVQFTGSTAAVRKAFGVTVSTFDKNGKTVTAPSSDVTVPTAYASLVSGISGLDSTAIMQPDQVGRENAKTAPAATGTQLPPPDPVFKNSGPCSTYFGQKMATSAPKFRGKTLPYAPCGYTPAQLRGAYGVNTQLGAGYDGRGVRVAIVDAYASKWIYNDASTYAAKNDPSHPLRSYQFSQSLPGSYRAIDLCGASGWYGEETLDVEAVHGIAPAASIKYVGASSCYDSDLGAAVNSIVDNHLADIVSNSYGETETSGKPAMQMTHQTALQAAAEGITLVFSSGDSGDEIIKSGVRQVDASGNDPLVTGVGGTSLAVGAGNTYGFEQGWGTGKSSLVNGAWSPLPPVWLYGAGGGTSKLFRQPWYQKGVVPSSIANYFGGPAGRAVPDVALDGDPNTGYLIGQSQTFPDGKIRYSQYRIGGTSLSAPLFAGTVAIANQRAGHPIGFANPKLYSLAGTAAFRDVTHSRGADTGVVRVDFANGFDGSDGLLTSLRTFNQTGTIFVRPGYDDVTGVGTPNGPAFFNALSR